MKDLLKEFFEEERKRIFSPDRDFAERVLGRVEDLPRQRKEPGIWEAVPGFARAVAALGLLLLLAVLLVETFFPMMPKRGIVDAYLTADEQPGDRWLYHGAELPSGRELLVEIFGVENQQ